MNSRLRPSLVFLHVGDTLPTYFIQVLYQSILIHQSSFIDFYILVNKINIPVLKKHISNFEIFDKEIFTTIHFIPLEILKQNYDVYQNYTKLMLNYEKTNPDLFQFRNQFWKVSTERFYYLYSFMLKYNLNNVFHLETDVMLYTPIPAIYENVCSSLVRLWVVQDSKQRAIGSIVFIPTSQILYQFLQFANSMLSKSYVNDMTLLGMFPLKHKFPDTPTNELGIFDGAALGQYLGGIDLRNSKQSHHKFINNTIGFVNETSEFKPNTYSYKISYRKILDGYPNNLKKYFCVDKKNNYYQIHNLHIHSKQPYNFSSVFDIQFTDLLTFSNILQKCDAVICTETVYSQNTSTIRDIDKVLLVKNPTSINIDRLTSCFKDLKKSHITCFIWDNLLDTFINSILTTLPFKFTIITNATEQYLDYIKLDITETNIDKIYTISPYDKQSSTVKFLPCITSIITEDEHLEFYGNMVNTYMYSKSSIVQFNEKVSYSELTKSCFLICNSLNYVWIALYLGVIPVFLLEENNSIQNMFIENISAFLESLNMPYITTTKDDITPSIFNKNTYNVILDNVFKGKSIYCNDLLKLSMYF